MVFFTKAVNYYATTASHTADKCIATINKDMKSSVNERGLINSRLYHTAKDNKIILHKGDCYK